MAKTNYRKGIYTPKNPSKYQGAYPITFRSGWEWKLMHWLDQNPSVVRWASESIVIKYYNPVKHREARYFPDFIADIKDKDGKISRYLIEIKPYKEVMAPVIKPRQRQTTRQYEQETYIQNQAKWEAAKKFCSMNNMKFTIITEKELFNKNDR